MFRFYMEFILNNTEKLTNLKEIISINEKMLYNIYNKKRKHNKYGGAENNTPEFYSKKIQEFKDSTISIMEKLGSNMDNQKSEMEKVNKALIELIKYINLLADIVKKKDLEKIKSQLSDLKKTIENKITQNTIKTDDI